MTTDCCDYDSDNAYKYFNVSNPSLDSLRMSDIGVFTSMSMTGYLLGWSVVDYTSDNNLNAGLSIIRTCFVCAVMAVSAVIFARDIFTLVLNPIENMLVKVERISKNPLEAA
jgi:hypothetical protein